METAYLINFRSGGGEGEWIANEVSTAIENQRLNGKVFDLTSLSDDSLVDILARFSLVVIGGGDGSVSRALTASLDSNPTFGILPLGTGNDFAREIKVLNEYRKLPLITYLQRLNVFKSRKISIWEVSGDEQVSLCKFVNYFSLGYDAEIVKRFSDSRPTLKNSQFGQWKNRIHYLSVAMSLRNSRLPKSVSIVGDELFDITSLLPLKAAIFSNIKSYMGIGQTSAIADPGDSLLEFVPVNHQLDYLKFIAQKQVPNMFSNSAFQSTNWKLSGISNLVFAQFDGEPISMNSNSLKIQIAGFKNVLVPQSLGQEILFSET